MDILTSGPPIRVGCDLGQVDDPSTVCVAEVTPVHLGRLKKVLQRNSMQTMLGKRTLEEEVDVPESDSSYRFPLIEQIALGTRYRLVARRIADIATSQRLLKRDVSIYADETGVGRPIVEMLIDELKQRRNGREINVFPITFVSSDNYNASTGKMGKAYLAAHLSILMEQHLLHFTKGSPHAEALRQQLLTFNRRMNERQHAEFGAFGSGQHDDLVIAIGLCTLEETHGELEVLDPELVEAIQFYRGF